MHSHFIATGERFELIGIQFRASISADLKPLHSHHRQFIVGIFTPATFKRRCAQDAARDKLAATRCQSQEKCSMIKGSVLFSLTF
jgi:hypothetical protein